MACLPVFIYLLLISFCKCDDQLTQAKQLIRPGDMLVSKNGFFALGFFSLATSNQSLFLGIWYNNIQERTYVWVANRNNPITNPSSAMLAISNSSDLVLSDSKGTLWTTMTNITGGDGAYAALLDSGNLVLRLPNNRTVWQSFDHPTDTILSNMKILLRYKEQVGMRLFAWKGPDDPSTGDFSCSGDPNSDLQVFVWHGTKPYYRSIVLDNVWVSGRAYGSNTSFMYQTFVNTQDEFYVIYTTSDSSPYMRIVLDYMGTFRLLSWNASSLSWAVYSQRPVTIGNCDLYDSCGPFSYCDFTLGIPRCQCIDGFEPYSSNSSRGCRRKQQLKCGGENHFVTIPGMKLPDKFFHVRDKSFEECASECSRNCSCTAYAYTNLTITGSPGTIVGQSRCLLWVGELVDMARNNLGDNLYLRLAKSLGMEIMEG
uniref:non-specific serine/threonine protein kinase n=1 Tax=Leersia perrieri TaxID=77586 RepID=A0A0D9W9Z9_9ORYZ